MPCQVRWRESPLGDDPWVELSNYLSARRVAILNAWRTAVDRDPRLTTASTITRAQFNDHIPQVLDAFQEQLRAETAQERAEAKMEEEEGASEHGLRRWQQGYDQRETMCEWGHMHLCLLDEIESFGTARPHVAPAVLRVARRRLAQLCSDGTCESASRYAELQRAGAASRVQSCLEHWNICIRCRNSDLA